MFEPHHCYSMNQIPLNHQSRENRFVLWAPGLRQNIFQLIKRLYKLNFVINRLFKLLLKEELQCSLVFLCLCVSTPIGFWLQDPTKFSLFTLNYSPLQRGEVPLYSSLRRFPIIPVTLHRCQHRGGCVK